MMQNQSKKRTPEQKMRKMLKEEKIIMDLELAIKTEEFRNNPPSKDTLKV